MVFILNEVCSKSPDAFHDPFGPTTPKVKKITWQRIPHPLGSFEGSTKISAPRHSRQGLDKPQPNFNGSERGLQEIISLAGRSIPEPKCIGHPSVGNFSRVD